MNRRNHMKKRILLLLAALFICSTTIVKGAATQLPSAAPETLEEIESWWKAGKTLPLETTANYPLKELRITNDSGINVLIDMAHKCDFFTLWNLGRQLHSRGIRTVGSHATLDSVLTPGSPCRVRIPAASGVYPFAWWPAVRFNVVLTEGAPHYPGYIAEERKVLTQFISDGGGWAVNAYLPKEASTISTSANGIRSIFGHEQAHTMSGPCQVAKHPFGGNRGEEHAGWFQGKINAKYNGDTGPNRRCNQVFAREHDGSQKTAEQIFKKEHLEKWRTGHDRLMIWYVWQKLDDRYGPTWYPRWRWVQENRWKNDPGRNLTWEESIEDMSIAVGEDLFGFFGKTGKKLSRQRFEKAVFMGKGMVLPVAPIEPTPPGDVCLDPITDYTKPITVKK